MITIWTQLPIVMHPEHIAQLLGVERSTIWRRCRQRRMKPAPDSYEKPWTWNRDRVRAQLEAGVTHVPIGRPSRRRPLQRATEAFAAAHQSTEAPAQYRAREA